MLADDIRFAVGGPPGSVGGAVVDITDEAAYVLEDLLHMQLSRDKEGVEGKTVPVASSGFIHARMAKGMTKMGIRTKEPWYRFWGG